MAEPPPVGGQTGATTEPMTKFPRTDLVGQTLQIVIGRIDLDVRREQEQIDAVEFRAVDLGGRRQVEHRVEADGRFGIGSFSDDSRPGRVVKFRELIACGRVHDRLALRRVEETVRPSEWRTT